jgi:hypothetical protein
MARPAAASPALTACFGHQLLSWAAPAASRAASSSAAAKPCAQVLQMAEPGLPVQTDQVARAASHGLLHPSTVEAGDGPRGWGRGSVARARSASRADARPGWARATHLVRQSPAGATQAEHLRQPQRPEVSAVGPIPPPPGGTGTGSSGSLVRPPSSGSTSAQRASPRLRAHSPTRSATTTASHLCPSASGRGAARCRRATAYWAARQPLARQGAARHWRPQLQRRRREEGTCLPLAHHRPQVNHNGDPGRSGDSTPERSCARRTSRKPSQPLR